MYTTWKLTIASIKMFVRNRQALFFTFFTPLLIMVIFGAIGFDRTPTISVGVVVQGTIDANSQMFLKQLGDIKVFSLHYGSLQNERKALEEGNRAIVLELQVKEGSFTILKNTGDPQAETVISILSQMLDKAAMAQAHTPALVALDIQEVNVHNLKYIDFLLPGLIAMAVMQLSVFSVAFVFVDYKEKGILKRVLATPVRPYQFVVANIITRLLVAVFQAFFFIAVGIILFKVTIVGSYALILLIVILGAILFLGLGFIISGISKTTESVPALANLIVFPMLFLGGTFFPIDSMPTWLQYVSKILPLTYFSTALRDVMNKGAGVSGILFNLVIMCGWAIVLVLLAIYTFSFEEKHKT